MTEPDAGSDLQGIRTTAKWVAIMRIIFVVINFVSVFFRRDGDDWIINGSKIYITNG